MARHVARHDGLPLRRASRGSAVLVVLGLALLWETATILHLYRPIVFPTPVDTFRALVTEATTGRLFDDVVASLLRVSVGFVCAVLVGVPTGLAIGTHSTLRSAVLPLVNFLRSLSTIAWIPFAILWFGIGDPPVIFLVFLAGVFPVCVATATAVGFIPGVYFKVANDMGMTRFQTMRTVTFPAVLPQVIAALRIAAGIAWVVVVAAEMTAGREGIGWAIWDARNGLRTDILVVEMMVLGTLGVATDALLQSAGRLPALRWGSER